jgi:photosystem II protein
VPTKRVAPVRMVECDAAALQFIRGIDEPSIPEVRLTRSRTGGSGAAAFVFENPSIFQASGEMGDITGLFMVDDEGTLTTTDVKAKFVNGKPQAIEARFTMRSQFEWDRFMRFMDRYAEQNGLGFEGGQKVRRMDRMGQTIGGKLLVAGARLDAKGRPQGGPGVAPGRPRGGLGEAPGRPQGVARGGPGEAPGRPRGGQCL